MTFKLLFASCVTFPVECSSHLRHFQCSTNPCCLFLSQSLFHQWPHKDRPWPPLHLLVQLSSVHISFLFPKCLPCDHGYSIKKARMWTESWILLAWSLVSPKRPVSKGRARSETVGKSGTDRELPQMVLGWKRRSSGIYSEPSHCGLCRDWLFPSQLAMSDICKAKIEDNPLLFSRWATYIYKFLLFSYVLPWKQGFLNCLNIRKSLYSENC